jgi:long-chain fatty acid transport protein
MMKDSKRLLAIAVAAAIGVPGAAYATNGMNLEGYGPVATGMGGASMAYDNGTAAMMNNPATLGLMDEGNRVDVSLGALGPDISAENDFGKANSSADSFLMPAIGWARKRGQFAYGVGAFAQGGMGAEYGAGSSVDQSGPAGTGMACGPTGCSTFPNATASGVTDNSNTQRSELGVGRILFPLSYSVNDQLTIGGSLDYVWGGLDIMWSMDSINFLGALDNRPGVIDDGAGGAILAQLAPAVGPQNTRARASGTMVDTFVAGFGSSFAGLNWGHFEFSDGSDFTQATRGDGFAGKLGFVFKANDKLSIGGTYHAKTQMSDFEGDVDVAFNVTAITDPTTGAVANATVTIPGTVKVVDFQWPETYGLGVAYQATDKLMLAADWKRLNWSQVMDSFKMEITADSNLSGMAAGFSDTVLNFEYFQNWDDQDVIQLGAAYDVTDAFTVRAGYNHADNPIPDDNVSFLFPATIEDHYTLGFGYEFTPVSSVDFSLTYAPEVSVTESATESNNLGTSPENTIKHSQTSWQLMYSHRF